MPHDSRATPGHSGTDTLTFRIAFLLIALLLRLVSVAERTDNIIHFKSPHRSMIVVDVHVNGTGPYSFVLDTGSTSSVVDPQLSVALKLSAAPGVKVASWQDTTDARRVGVQSLSLGPLDSGPISVLVQSLSEFKAFDPHLRGVLGQDVLLCSNFLIDYRHHLIEFDNDGELLSQLAGDRVSILPVRTQTGDLEPRLLSVSLQSDIRSQPLHLLLDTGADMLVLKSVFEPPASGPSGSKWMADENGRSSPASTFHITLLVGADAFTAEAWIGNAGLKQIEIDGLLPAGRFNLLYIANHGSFVIFEPRHANPEKDQRRKSRRSSPGL